MSGLWGGICRRVWYQVHRKIGMSKMKKNMEEFGEAIWAWIKGRGGEIFEYEDSEEIMEIAERHGLADRVNYDPKIHGDINADPGDEIWWFGD